jgi:diphthine methyl ester synthase
MALYLIGLGLGDEKDITLKGLEAVRKSEFVYLESYTSKLSCSIDDMEALYGKKIIAANRALVEQSDEIVNNAKEHDVALLIIGDVFAATTHTDIKLRAEGEGIKVMVINNSSVLTAVGITGLELYKFGRTVSIPFHNKDVVSPVNMIKDNQNIGLHTLVLLDLVPEENRYMTVAMAAEYLVSKGLDKSLIAVGCAALGTDGREIVAGILGEFAEQKHAFSRFPQCLIIVGKMHFMEENSLDRFKK